MKNYDEMFQKVLARREEYEKKKKKRTVIIKRTAAAVFGTAAVLGIGLTTYVLRPPKKPTPNQSGIIAETETTSAETTTAPTSSSTAAPQTVTTEQTTVITALTTVSSALSTTATVHTTVTATHTTKTSAVTTRATVCTTSAQTSAATTALTTTTAMPPTTAATTQTTTAPAVSTTQTGYLTTLPVRPPSTGTTTTNSGSHVYRLNQITIGTETTVYMKTGVECPSDIVREKREDTTITGVWGERDHTENVGIYTIDGVSDSFAVVVFYQSTFDWPVYINTEYEPDTLGCMLDDMGLEKHMSFGSQNVKVSGENGYYDVSAEKIMKVLGDCRDAVNTKEGIASFSRDLTIYPDITYMRYNTSIYISKEGYITTKMTDRGASFYIGEEKALSCIEYLLGT